LYQNFPSTLKKRRQSYHEVLDVLAQKLKPKRKKATFDNDQLTIIDDHDQNAQHAKNVNEKFELEGIRSNYCVKIF